MILLNLALLVKDTHTVQVPQRKKSFKMKNGITYREIP